MPQGWIGIDLDGTLAFYDGWKGIEHIGPPIPRMVDRIQGWLAREQKVKIVTARVFIYPDATSDDIEQAQRARSAIMKWCKEHIGVYLPITCTKDFSMIELWDDRAVQVFPNSGVRVDGLE